MANSKLGIVLRAAGVIAVVCWLAIVRQSAGLAAPSAIIWPHIYLTEIENGFDAPVHITNADDGSNRLFVVEQRGEIQIVENGQMLGTPFLDISETAADSDHRVVQCCGEEGLLSVAFPPGYPNGTADHFYVYYTSDVTNTAPTPDINPGDNVVARYELTGDDDVADPDSAEIVLVLDHPGESNHNGGQLQFGPNDGYLYISTGDGGGGGDPNENAQNVNILMGKILRIDVETGDPATYTNPATNPFVGGPGLDEIWALGLRNPWRFSFDRDTGDMYIGDVGQGDWEEVDYQPADVGGQNYGWDCYEAEEEFDDNDCGPIGNYIFPISVYDNDGGRAVSGGYVYRGLVYEAMQGFYFYADHAQGQIWAVKHDGADWQTSQRADASFQISSFGEDEAGNLYVAARNTGRIYLITGDTNFRHLPLILKN